ncbi:hypothetical protein ACIGXM_36020 [Kitasatospora sp. NPDC052896]|uniref:hypothetical protein n=1 Tax=Kitasatospora sp. NPDC052896 TaxID=3364061 RepID=UPI0037C6F266
MRRLAAPGTLRPAAPTVPAGRMVYWWRRAWPGHTRAGYPPVALVVTDAGPVALANRQEAVAELSAECWGGQRYTAPRDDNDGDGWREYDDAVPVNASVGSGDWRPV